MWRAASALVAVAPVAAATGCGDSSAEQSQRACCKKPVVLTLWLRFNHAQAKQPASLARADPRVPSSPRGVI
jgi:hypothetical protein